MRHAQKLAVDTADGAEVQDFDAAFEMLRSALIAVVDGRASSSNVRPALRQLCVCARAEDLKAEQLLVRFKELWSSLPSLAGLPRGRQRNDLMARVTTMCIEEFYAPSLGNRPPHDS